MKVLLLVQKHQRVILDSLYEAIGRHCEHCDIRRLDDRQQRNLKAYFRQHVNTADYDRIVLFLRFKKMIRQTRFIRTLPNLAIVEHDAWQNFVPGKYRGVYSRYYRRLPWARVINSGFMVSEKLRAEGVDSHFAPKGYDPGLLVDQGKTRDIELGFVGSSKHALYARRREFLAALGEREDLLVTRTRSGAEYRDMLNRIRFFVSADVGFGEYMIKNFEAMACGCVLCAWDQGEAENRALGFRDMENIVLFRSLDELQEKLGVLRGNDRQTQAIADAGRTLAATTLTWQEAGRKVSEKLALPLRERPVERRWFFPRRRAGARQVD